MSKNDIPTINVNVKHCTNWKTWILVCAAFCAGAIYGKVSMAMYQEKNKEKETKEDDDREED